MARRCAQPARRRKWPCLIGKGLRFRRPVVDSAAGERRARRGGRRL
jgi:hypothetical protein